MLFGKILNMLHWCRFSYLTKKNTNSVNNQGSSISGNVILSCPENVFIGKNSYINGGHIFASPNAKIVIGDDCLISYNVHMRTDTHNYSDRNKLIRSQGLFEKDIIIGNDVWIGYGAQILSGVTIADGCVVGAGAIVTKDTEPYGVYAGVPAKLIKRREDMGK